MVVLRTALKNEKTVGGMYKNVVVTIIPIIGFSMKKEKVSIHVNILQGYSKTIFIYEKKKC